MSQGWASLSYDNITIIDAPTYGHRSIMIDLGRRLFPIHFVKSILNAMSYAKLNVLHWHISDSESIPYHTKKYPKLWEGAWSRDEKYSLGVRETRF